MSVIAEFYLPPEALPAGDMLVENPDIRIEIERVVPLQESSLPLFWVWGPNPDRFVEYAARERDLADVELLERVENGALFRAEWIPDASLIHGIKRLDATIIEATGTAERWQIELRARERDTLNEFRELFQHQGVSVHLNYVYDVAELVDGDTGPITPEQRETLLRAHRKGYFDQPREVTQEELAEYFDISRRAISDRLRRGVRNLVEASLLPEGNQQSTNISPGARHP